MGYIPREDRGKELLEPDVMTPVQFYGAFRRRSWQDGERRLMSAVLQDGIETFQKYALARDELGREQFEEAQRWLTARFDRSLFSFVTLCDLLEIDAEYLRSGMLRWWERQRLRALSRGRKQLFRTDGSTQIEEDERRLLPRRLVRGAHRVANGS